MSSGEVLTGAKILVVDDDAVTLQVLCSMLDKKGCRIIATASSGEEALEKAGYCSPDIVLMDMCLTGEMDGSEAARLLYERHGIRVVYITAFSDKETIEKVKATDPYGFVTKPVERKYLYITLELALHKIRLEKEREKAGRELREAYDRLELRVAERTEELSRINAALKSKVNMRRRVELSLRASEKKLRENHEKLRKLAGGLIAAQEGERRRIARELHDDLTQRLAALAMEISALEKRLAAPSDYVAAGLCRIREGLMTLSEDIHTISRQLHPSILDDLGLIQTLRSECRNYYRRTGIKVDFASHGIQEPLPRDKTLCIYRVVQECLKNTEKHASTKDVSLRIDSTEHDLVLTVEDSGVGFNPLMRGHGIGLTSMKERALLVDGALSILSSPGRGTKVVLRLPLPGEEGNHR